MYQDVLTIILRYLFRNLYSISRLELDAISPDGFKDRVVQQQFMFRHLRLAAEQPVHFA